MKKRFAMPIFSFHRYLGYYPTPNFEKGKNRHNSLGYRGDEIVMPKPEGEYRIVCLGGSTTYTSKIEDYQLSYPYLLEKNLIDAGYKNVKVVNAGCSAWSSMESMINFEIRVLDLDPDMVIVYHGINDVHPRLVWPPSAYRGDGSGSKIPGIPYIYTPSVFEYSTLIRGVMIKLGLSKPHSAITGILTIPPETYYGDLFREQMIDKIYPSGIFKKISAEQMLMTNQPIYFRRNIENIVILARENGIKTILATFAYSPLFEELPRAFSKEYRTAYEETNNVLKAVAEKNDVNLFDFAGLFPNDKRYYTDGRHVSEEGAKLKAKLFAQYIIDNNLIPDEKQNIKGIGSREQQPYSKIENIDE
ncbi:MAG: SGNH/GDSL hydrolase family protein [Candidatus Omnitrophica bacterium]|nr:SGNH/GDSL hydrolase family protein [Candidatus Omnitrophota bacterium]